MEKITIIILAYLLLSIQPEITNAEYDLNSQCSDEKISEVFKLQNTDEISPATLIERKETFCWEGPIPTEDCYLADLTMHCGGGGSFCTGLCTTVDGCTICFPCYTEGDPFPEEQ
jgi:hypothetical protein